MDDKGDHAEDAGSNLVDEQVKYFARTALGGFCLVSTRIFVPKNKTNPPKKDA